jgi:hypothetical protein
MKMARMTGARFMAETVHGHGIDYGFFMPYIAPRALMEMERLGIKRIQTHGEKAAAYIADGYARARRGPGLCMAQSVGAANLAAGLQDAYLSCLPVIALTGREYQRDQQRHASQKVKGADVPLKEGLLRLTGQAGDKGLFRVPEPQAEQVCSHLLSGNDSLCLPKVDLPDLPWSVVQRNEHLGTQLLALLPHVAAHR